MTVTFPFTAKRAWQRIKRHIDGLHTKNAWVGHQALLERIKDAVCSQSSSTSSHTSVCRFVFANIPSLISFMSSVRKKSSFRNFFRFKSTGTIHLESRDADTVVSKPPNSRSTSLPINNLLPTTRTKSLESHSLQPSETPTMALAFAPTFPIPEVPIEFRKEQSPEPEAIPTAIPVPMDGEAQQVAQLASIADQAEVVIQADTERAIERNKYDEEVRVFKAFDDMLQLKSNAELIVSHVKSTLSEDPWFMKGLDEVAKIHPFVSVAVLAFKAVYNMELTRRQNDRRIVALFVEMKDMIGVLTRLKTIKDPDIVAPNSLTIKGRMQTLVNQTAQDIKDCANACDTYTKKKLLVRVLVGPAWEGRLVAFTSAFSKRRMEFEFALSIHTATGVDAIQAVANAMNDRLAIMHEQFLIAFSKMRPEAETQLAETVQKRGGIDVVKNDDNILRELFKANHQMQHDRNKGLGKGDGGGANAAAKATRDVDGTKVDKSNKHVSQRSSYEFEDLKQDLREDWEQSLKNNLDAFEGKFRLWHDNLERNLQSFMHEESNRVIDEVNKGPHDLIQNEEIKTIWKDMHWRRNVKARLFVMTLRDYFADADKTDGLAVSEQAEKQPVSSDEGNEAHADDWARQYIDVKYLQPIMDAFDDDGSGYITISEINRFSETLPGLLTWSFKRWVAFWAIGWQSAAVKYRVEILQTFARMYAMRKDILPVNRQRVEYYLDQTWSTASRLAKSIRAPATLPAEVEAKFKEYVDYEEDRIHQNLAGIKYDIDALDTVYGVLGPGRIEKHVLTLICLLLRRDLQLFNLATKIQLHDDELWDAADSLLWVYDAVEFRYQDLLALFQQQKLDVDKQMRSIAGELFDYYHNSATVWKMSNLQSAKEQEPDNEVYPVFTPADGQDINNYAFPPEDVNLHVYDVDSAVNGPEVETDAAKATTPESEVAGASPDAQVPTVASEAETADSGHPSDVQPTKVGTESVDRQSSDEVDGAASVVQEPPPTQEASTAAEEPSLQKDDDSHVEVLPEDTLDNPQGVPTSVASADPGSMTEVEAPEVAIGVTSIEPTVAKIQEDAIDLDDKTSVPEIAIATDPASSSSTDPITSNASQPVETTKTEEQSTETKITEVFDTSEAVKSLTGTWSGFMHDSEGQSVMANFTFNLQPVVGKDYHLEASGLFVGTPYNMTCTISKGQNIDWIFKLTVVYTKDLMTKYYSGTQQMDGSLLGTQGYSEEEESHQFNFIFIQIPEDLMVLRPLPPYNIPCGTDGGVVPSKTRALADYAIRAVIHQNRQKRWSWEYIRQRREDRLRYHEFDKYYYVEGRTMSDDDTKKWYEILHAISCTDMNFYQATRWYRTVMPNHLGFVCDKCRIEMHGERHVCLGCLDNQTPETFYYDTSDFCRDVECWNSTIEPNADLNSMKKPHIPSHDLLKVRTVLQKRDIPAVYRLAKKSLEACRRIFDHTAPQSTNDDDSETGDAQPAVQAVGGDLSKDNTTPPECHVCSKMVKLPCWYCVGCYENDETSKVLLCEDCESQTLLRCRGCEKPFRQPTWFYGTQPGDNFMCNKCTVTKKSPDETPNFTSHTYLHPLVRCQVNDNSEKVLSTDERICALETSVTDKIATLETSVSSVDDKVKSLDGKMLRMEAYLERMEQILNRLVPPKAVHVVEHEASKSNDTRFDHAAVSQQDTTLST